jgi:hypothetical protein
VLRLKEAAAGLPAQRVAKLSQEEAGVNVQPLYDD